MCDTWRGCSPARDESSTSWISLASSRVALPRLTHVTEPGLRFLDAGDAGELLDARAKQAYRRRLTEIEDDLEEARALGDASRMAQAKAERDFLARELSRAVGLGGRDRRVGSAAERARASVTRAVRQAMGRIRAHHPPLAAHLERGHPHRYLLRLSSRPSRPDRVEAVTIRRRVSLFLQDLPPDADSHPARSSVFRLFALNS